MSVRGVLCAGLVLVVSSIAFAGNGSEALGEERRLQIAELIEQLGATKYVVRRTAQERLREQGLAAFDQLLVSSDDPDPEIASASRRLLRTMTIRWSRPGDAPEVLRLLEPYGGYSEPQRREVIGRLAALGDGGVAALCRIARFDASGRVSRRAALAVFQETKFEPDRSRAEAIRRAEQQLTDEFGPSLRPAGRWIRLFELQVENPVASLDGWRAAIAAERRAVDKRRPETDERVLAQLRWNWLRAQLAAGSEEGLGETVDALIAAAPTKAEAILTRSLEWMVLAGADAGVDALLDDRREQLTTKRGLYLAAMIRDKQGRLPDAAELAKQAFETAPAPGDDRVVDNRKLIDGRVPTGDWLDKSGYAEWARREYAEAAEQTPVLSANAACARWRLANSLFDHERYDEARAVLTKVTDAIDGSLQTRARYESLADDYEFLPAINELIARREYYHSMADRDAGRAADQVRRLRTAIEQDPTDADFLIALYRAARVGVAEGEGGNALRTEAAGLVRKLADSLQAKIDSNPEDPRHYNHWAWLISNTEGDFAKAVRYSRQSLAQRPGDAGYLDTLGRCYYAVGDLEQAVRYQREAVRREPHMRVLRRQLELFESELQAADNAEPSSQPSTPAGDTPDTKSDVTNSAEPAA